MLSMYSTVKTVMTMNSGRAKPVPSRKPKAAPVLKLKSR